MLSFPLDKRIYIVHQTVDFRNGIEGLSAFCARVLKEDPYSGSVFVFCNKSRTSIKLIFYDTQGFWLCQKNLSKGKFQVWPKEGSLFSKKQAHEPMVLLWNGDPTKANFKEGWKKVA